MHKRRRHTLEFKRQIVEETCEPGASIASVALAHRLNSNQVHKWRRELLSSIVSEPVPALLPVTIKPDAPHLSIPHASTSMPYDGTIDIVFARASLSVRGPVDLAALELMLKVLHQR